MRQLLDKIKTKLSLKLMLCIGLLFILIGGASLANLSYRIEGEGTNLVEAGCLQISIEEKNTINLTDQVPIKDEAGRKSVPYIYKISNTCSLEAYYETSINVLNTANVENASKVKVFLTGDNYIEPVLISDLKEIQLVEKPNDVVKSYLIDSGYLKPNQSKSFNLRMWIDYDVESFTGNFDNRIIVNSIADIGPNFDSATTGYQIVGKQGVNQTTVLNPNFTLSSEDNNQTSGLYKLVGINDNMTYIFRGNVNNYFKIGTYPKNLSVTYTKSDNTQATITHHTSDDMIWRIVRINEDGSVKLILDDVIGTSNVNNSNASTTYNNSNLKTMVDNFYNEYLTNIQDYIVQTKFCTSVNSSLPTLRCDNNDIVQANIGLLSADELKTAGAAINKTNSTYYLNKDVNGWYTLTPTNALNGNYNYISSLSTNSVANSLVTETLAVRPIISIEKNYILKGNGTQANPYEIVRPINEKKVLTIDANGGNYSGDTTINVIVGDTYFLDVPTKTNYEFTGWEVTSGTGTTTNGNTVTMGSTDSTIKAKWQEQKLLTIDANGGIYTGETNVFVGIGKQYTLSVPTKTNYHITGWEVTSGTGTTVSDNIVTMGTTNSTVRAIWEADTRTLTIDADGGTYTGDTSVSVGIGNQYTLNTPTKPNYDFTGWIVTIGTGTTVSGNTVTMGTTNSTVKATWVLATKLLTINADGGNYSGGTSLQVLPGATQSLSKPTKTDYTFAGWEVTSGTGTSSSGDAVTMGTTDSTIKAKWVKTVTNFEYTGSAPTSAYTAIPGTYKLEVWGAEGGTSSSYTGGKGGYSIGNLTLTSNADLYVYVGGKGTNAPSSTGSSAGGFNGGGNANTSSSSYKHAAGGGATDIRINNSTSLYARVIVAGGGGGAGYNKAGGAGGGTSGVAGSTSSSGSYKAGAGGSATAGGTSYYGTSTNSTSYGTLSGFGVGASGTSNTIAGGGGGWYGGGYARRASAGGGSGYVYTSTTASQCPTGCLLNSTYYLTSASTKAGNTSFTDYSGSTVTGHSGNGAARITVVSISY